MTEIHLFRGTARAFGCTADARGANLPSKFGRWSAFKTIHLERGVQVPGVNADECLDDVAKYAFHLTEAHVRSTEQAL